MSGATNDILQAAGGQAATPMIVLELYQARPWVAPGVDKNGFWRPVATLKRFFPVTERPGLDHHLLSSGLQRPLEPVGLYPWDLDPVKVIVGDSDHAWFLPEAHIKTIPHFRRALEGCWPEATMKTMRLKDESPHAFQLFIWWLYQGFPSLETGSLLSKTLIETDSYHWVMLLKMLDKWALEPSFKATVAIWLINVLVRSHANHDWRDIAATNQFLEKLVACYFQVVNNDFRFVIVHFLALNTSFLHHALTYLDALENVSESNLLIEIAKWSKYLGAMTSVQVPSNGGPIRRRRPFGTDDAHTDLVFAVSDVRVFLVPLLFSLVPWTDKITQVWPSSETDPAQVRQIIRDHFEM